MASKSFKIIRVMYEGLAKFFELTGEKGLARQYADAASQLTAEGFQKSLDNITKNKDKLAKTLDMSGVADDIMNAGKDGMDAMKSLRNEIARSGLGAALEKSLMDSLSPEARRALDFILYGKLDPPTARKFSPAYIPGGGGAAAAAADKDSGAARRRAISPSTLFRSSVGIQSRLYEIQMKSVAIQEKLLGEAKKTSKATGKLADSIIGV